MKSYTVKQLVDTCTCQHIPRPAGAHCPDEYLHSFDMVPAKFPGKARLISDIDTIVIHRLVKADAARGARYVSKNTNRHVSWHYTVGEDGEVIQHLPLDTIGHHCKYPRGTNARSVGIELYGPFGTPISDEAHAAVRRLCSAMVALCPIRTIASHRHMDARGPRANRQDPGDEFDWSCLERLGPMLLA